MIPTSIRLKSNIKTPKGKYIIRRAELALLNERIRAINNSIAMFKIVIDTCMNQLKSILDRRTMEECHSYMEYRREGRHQSTLKRHLSKFQKLCHVNTGGHPNIWHGEQVHVHDNNCCSNFHTCMNNAYSTQDLNNMSTSNNKDASNISNNNNWVRNHSKTPLTEAQQRLLSHGPNFVITPRDLPTIEYIVATEKVCNQLSQGKAEELRGEVKTLLRKDHKTKPNIPKHEYQALREMKKDNTRQVSHSRQGCFHGGAGQ